MQGIQLTGDVLHTFADADELAEAIELTANVSFLKAAMVIREELLQAGTPPSARTPTRDDLAIAEKALRNHKYTQKAANT